MENECFGQLLPVVSLPYFRQNNKALLPLLDETIKRIVVQIIEFHPFADTVHFYHQRRVTYLAF